MGEVYGHNQIERKYASSWRRARLQEDSGSLVPWFWLATTVIRGMRRRVLRKSAASLRACMEGGWRTQWKLWVEGRASTDKCACGKESGTLWHKLATCTMGEEGRESAGKPPNLAGLIAQGRTQLWDPLFSRGVPARPKFPPPPQARKWWRPEVTGAVEIASGDVYTDGSAAGMCWRAVRAGWAAMAMAPNGQVLWTAGGVCGEPHASILRAELRAVLEVLKIAVAPLCIHVDNATVVQGFKEGPEWGCSSARDGADLWKEIWELKKEVGEGIRVVKVKAHTSWWDVLFGRISARDRGGNDIADKEAKKALKEALKQSPTASVNAYIARAVGWARWIAEYATGWIQDATVEAEEEVEEGERRGNEREATGGSTRSTMGHEIWDVKGMWVCRRCGRQSPDNDERRALKSSPCLGSVGGRAMVHATGNRNFLWNKHSLSTEGLQVQGARLVQRSSVPAHMVEAERIGEMEGTYAKRLQQSLLWAGGEGSSENGVRGRSVGGGSVEVDEGSEGWRPWHEDPSWLYLPHLWEEKRKQEDGFKGSRGTEEGMGSHAATQVQRGGHWLRCTGNLVWCSRCACFAHKRFGAGLKGACKPVMEGAAKARLARLHGGKHPITGKPMREEGKKSAVHVS